MCDDHGICYLLQWFYSEVFWTIDVSYSGIGSYTWTSEALSNKKVTNEITNWCSGKGFCLTSGETECLEC